MANRFLKALAAVKLVELDEEEVKKVAAEPDGMTMAEIDAIIAAEDAAAAQTPPKPKPKLPDPTPPPARPTTATSSIVEDLPFAEIFAHHGVPEAPFSAEKLLRVLDGLKAMPPETRKAAVVAMDSADEDWTIADAVLDAQRKVRVLDQMQQHVESQVQQIVATASHEKSTRDDYLAKATSQIQEKIKGLEEMLQQETAQIVAQKTEIDGKVEAARAAATREVARLQAEAHKLREVPAMFAVHATE